MSDTSRYSKRRPRRTTDRPDVEDILKSMNWETRLQEARKKRAAVLAQRAADAARAAKAAPDAEVPADAPAEAEVMITEETRLVAPAAAAQEATPEPAPAVTRVVAEPAAPRGARAYFGLGAGIGLGLAAGLAIASFVSFRSQPSLPQARLDTGPGPAAFNAPIDPPAMARSDVGPVVPAAVARRVASAAPGVVAPAAAPDARPASVQAAASLPQIAAEAVPANALATSLIPRARPQVQEAVAGLPNEGAPSPQSGADPDETVAVASERPVALPQVTPALADAPQPSAAIVAAKWLSVPSADADPVSRLPQTTGAGLPLRLAVPPVLVMTAPASKRIATPTAPDALTPEALPAPQTASPPEPTAEPQETRLASLDPAASTRAAPVRLRVNVPSLVPESRLSEVVSELSSLGYAPDRAARVNFTVSRNHVRFYHAEDLPAAEQIAETIGGTARDFTDFRPSPSTGTIEAFIAGSAPAVQEEAPRSRNIDDVLSDLFSRLRGDRAGN